MLPDTVPIVVHKEGEPATVTRTRRFYDAALRKTVEAQEVERDTMKPGVRVDGPAIVIENETTIIVTSAFSAIGQSDGSLCLSRKGESL